MRVDVVHNVTKLNDAMAQQIRETLREKRIFCLNLISSPGSGKTTILERTLDHLRDELRCAVIVGDLATSIDAYRMAEYAPTIQINTDGGCHLDAAMVSTALESLKLDELDVLFIENVGNLVCPVGFDLGQDVKVGILSVTEGEDKVAKYPRIWREASIVLLNKIDLAPFVFFNRTKFYADLEQVNALLPVIEMSATKGDGVSRFCDWILREREDRLAIRR
ncbi:MAG: hydrogenase nickel incorporation protein HypB [Fimbriimonadaceae bacterium]|nr:hydrogenase nickel incorporation protein HypB [Fimbriimonadaceae bacterium]